MKPSEHKSIATTRPIPQEAFDWYDEYAHGLIDRREFMSRLSGLAVAGFSLTVLSTALLPNYAEAEQVSFNDPDIKATYVNFSSPDGHGECRGYLVVPSALEGTGPVVLVVHENRVEPLHQGCRSAAGQGRIHCHGTRCAAPARRLSRQRR